MADDVAADEYPLIGDVPGVPVEMLQGLIPPWRARRAPDYKDLAGFAGDI